jgi:CrcB protein
MRMMWSSIAVIGIGAALGAVMRWGLGVVLNSMFPLVPLGTLMANLVGGYLIGLAMTLDYQALWLSPLWRLAIVTGFLGGLTTFSTFSAEVVSLLQEGRLFWAGAVISLHLIGSLIMTWLGLFSGAFLRGMH